MNRELAKYQINAVSDWLEKAYEAPCNSIARGKIKCFHTKEIHRILRMVSDTQRVDNYGD